MPGKDLRELFDIAVNVRIEFRAEDDQDPAPQELRVEPGVGERDAVCRDEEVRVVKVLGRGVQERELDRPLPEF